MQRDNSHRQVLPADGRPAGRADPPGKLGLGRPAGDRLGQVLVRCRVAGQPPRDGWQHGGEIALVRRVSAAPGQVPELADHQPAARPVGGESASPATNATESAGLRAPTPSMPREKSQATQRAPAPVKALDEVPVPAATSSTRCPAAAPTALATARRQRLSWPAESTSLSRS